MDAPYFYLVKFWVHPESSKAVLDWLDSGHMADMVALPGFLFVRRVKLEQHSEDGWSGFMMIYGVELKAALQRYFDGPAPAKFAQQRKQVRTSPAHGTRVRRRRCLGDGGRTAWLSNQPASITGWITGCCIPRRSWPL